MRADTRHLGHHDHGRPGARDVDPLRHASERDLAMLKIVERVIDSHFRLEIVRVRMRLLLSLFAFIRPTEVPYPS